MQENNNITVLFDRFRSAPRKKRNNLFPTHAACTQACALRGQGKGAEATALHTKAFALQQQVLGPGHPDTLKSAAIWQVWYTLMTSPTCLSNCNTKDLVSLSFK